MDKPEEGWGDRSEDFSQVCLSVVLWVSTAFSEKQQAKQLLLIFPGEEFFVWLWGEGSRILRPQCLLELSFKAEYLMSFLGILPSLPWHFLLREKGNVELGGSMEGSERAWGRENMIKIYCLKSI